MPDEQWHTYLPVILHSSQVCRELSAFRANRGVRAIFQKQTNDFFIPKRGSPMKSRPGCN
jgi:hypothetical protein